MLQPWKTKWQKVRKMLYSDYGRPRRPTTNCSKDSNRRPISINYELYVNAYFVNTRPNKECPRRKSNARRKFCQPNDRPVYMPYARNSSSITGSRSNSIKKANKDLVRQKALKGFLTQIKPIIKDKANLQGQRDIINKGLQELIIYK